LLRDNLHYSIEILDPTVCERQPPLHQ
jgi:hypothetical protein